MTKMSVTKNAKFSFQFQRLNPFKTNLFNIFILPKVKGKFSIFCHTMKKGHTPIIIELTDKNKYDKKRKVFLPVLKVKSLQD